MPSRSTTTAVVLRGRPPKRTQNKRNNNRRNKIATISPAIQYRTVAPITTRTRNYSRRSTKINISKVSKPGVDWLKAAFAAPDFPALTPVGIPDQYTGRTLVKQFRYDSNFVALPDLDGNQYVIVPPVPGCAFFTTVGPPNASSSWSAIPYADASGLFGANGTVDDQVTSFRYMSQLVELVPTTNAMTWTGSIEVYKIPLRLTTYDSFYTVSGTNYYTTNYTVNGLRGIESTNCDRFSTPSNMGIFANATSDQPSFDFVNLKYAGRSVPQVVSVASPANAGYAENHYGSINNNSFGIVGFGNLDTIVIKLSGVSDVNSFRLKTWATMEFTVSPESTLYQYSIMSPLYDPYALEAYRAFVMSCPIAVTYFENGKFWDFIRKAATSISSALSFVPGPVGAIAGGVNQLIRPDRKSVV